MRKARVLTAAVALAVGIGFGWGGTTASAQTIAPGTQIRTDIRPIVTEQYSGGAGIGFGILDTGDSRETLSRETARALGINVTTPIYTNALAAVNNFGTTAAQNITSGGWFGGTFNGPELNTPAAPVYIDPQVRNGDPAHLVTAGNVTNTATIVTNGLQPLYRDYNGSFSENHNGSTFLSRANAANNLVAMIDPINATPIPFAYDNVTGGNGRGLGGASASGLDRLTSSVSYFANNNAQVPIQGRNDNPGFVTFVPLVPMEFGASTLMTPIAADATVNAALPGGVTRRLTLTVSAANVAAGNAAALIPDNIVGGASPNPNALYFPPNNATYRVTNAGQTIATSFAANPLLEVNNASLAIGNTENANGFVRADGSVQIIVQSNAVGNPVVSNTTVQLPSQAPRPYGSIVIPSLGINTGAAKLIDTGAPDTSATLVGTDILNRFGQYFDYSPRGNGANPNRGMLTLIGPTQQNVRNALGNGMIFTVDQGTVGLQRTAVNHTATVGSVPQLVAGAGGTTLVGDGLANQAKQTVFRGNMTGSNAAYIAPSAQGLAAGGAQVITGMSMGGDAFGPDSDIYFGVAPGSAGSPSSGVAQQAALNQNASDIYLSPTRGPFAVSSTDPLVARRQAPKTNALFVNQEVLGLGQNVGPAFNAAGSNDNLLDFKLFTGRALPINSLSNLDSPIRQTNEVSPASRPRVGADMLGSTFDTYFAIRGVDGIFKDTIASLFAGNALLGLVAGDHINALALYRPSVAPGVLGAANVEPGNVSLPTSPFFTGLGLGRFDPNLDGSLEGIDNFHNGASDMAMFTLAPGSPSLTAFGAADQLSAADVFVTDFDHTFAFYAAAEQIGLDFNDVIDGLSPVPEPTSLSLVIMAGLFTLRRSRSKKPTTRQV